MTANILYSDSANRPTGVNELLGLLDGCFLSSEARALPTYYSFAVSVVCDLGCPYCPRQTYGNTIDSGLMDMKIIEAFHRYLRFSQYTGLFGLGEPFLHPRFLDFIRTVKDAGGYAATSTHGMRLDEITAQKIVTSNLDELEISIDAVSTKVFSFLRTGADLNTIIENITRLQNLKKKMHVSHPTLRIASCISVYNLEEVLDLVRLAKRLEAASIVFTNIIITHPENKHISVYPSVAFDSMIEKAKKLGRNIGIEVQYFYQKPYPWLRSIKKNGNTKNKAAASYGCPMIWSSMSLDINGNIKPCCYYDEIFANYTDNSIENIFNNTRFRELRLRLMNSDLPDCCVDCGNLRPLTPQYLNEKVISAEKSLQEIQPIIVEQDHISLKELLNSYRNMAHAYIRSYKNRVI